MPRADALPGGVQYSIKLDGFRAVAFARGADPAVLQSRSGRDLAPDFPTVAAAVAELPDGTVLDGELCAWHEGRLDFGRLVQSARGRERDGVPVGYVAFDLLAVPGRDLRALPLRTRWELLIELLDGTGPPLQLVMATDDRAEALDWRAALAPTGVEGLVARGLDTPYQPRLRRAWLKIRDSDTADVTVLGYTGTARRPRALLTESADGTRAFTSPKLNAVQARDVGEALAGRELGGTEEDPDQGVVHLVEPLTAEVTAEVGRSPYVKFVRLRGD
ncbi:DNA ligase [Yinghuangia seranimata]|nr:DNA ligase [Yinghuangia seranimata]MDI2131882.1 DNA ligase [Yinghuangia seranimata]